MPHPDPHQGLDDPTSTAATPSQEPTTASNSQHSRDLGSGYSRRSRRSAAMMPHPDTIEQVLDTHTASMRQVARELLVGTSMRSRKSFVGDFRRSSQSAAVRDRDSSLKSDEQSHLISIDPEESQSSYGATTMLDNMQERDGLLNDDKSAHPPPQHSRGSSDHRPPISKFEHVLNQTTAVAVVCLLNMMISIPFGSSYFPVGWKADGDVSTEDAGTDDEVHGSFPIAAKQALGIRMFLFATVIGQFAFTFSSKFTNPVGLQMVENIPFLHALCNTVIQQQGYGKEALSTVFFLFGLSSVVVGLTFWLLGKWQLGRIVYFFPNHVLVGCIGGIGVFILITAIEVTNNETFTFDWDGLVGFADHFHLFAVVLFFELFLRLLMYKTQDADGVAKYPYLSPVYFCCITPAFYLGLRLLGISMDQATEMGYFFPTTVEAGATDTTTTSWWHDDNLWDIFQVIDLSTVSWSAVFHSTGTMVALAAFSLIHVPINIPAFAISTDVEVDMNAELMAHGYANFASGMFGGLQNYVTYSNSVLYAKSGGNGKASSMAIVGLTILLFFIGPQIASFLPRCMAGTLLCHIGVDLVLEGVYDSFGNYDILEYTGIWVITLVMTTWGMSAALIAGVISAMSTYAVQSINHQEPIRQILSATTLRSSDWNRCATARAILEDDVTGRSRILVFQLQGHLFFGNIAQLTDTIKDILKEKQLLGEMPLVVIVDFTLVVGMDSSAAHAVAKLKKIVHRLFGVEVSIFVTGSGRGGFPCEYALTEALCPEAAEHIQGAGIDWNDVPAEDVAEPSESRRDDSTKSAVNRGSISVSPGTASVAASQLLSERTDGQVCESLDEALRFAEDILIAREKPSLVHSNSRASCIDISDLAMIDMSLQEEQYHAKKYLKELFSSADMLSSDAIEANAELLLSFMERKEYLKEQALWEQGDDSDCAQLLVVGELLSIIEDTGASERVRFGNMVGELGLVHEAKRLTTLICSSDKAVLYSLSRQNWHIISTQYPQLARMVDAIVIRYLAHRVQHVSNRYFTTTLPV
mmetsp:Transcript_40051/g.96643  ORF Transcript_40051/g.96643 Transcript_40051/m.96643 type:complete len:1036 (-) Transcript_40051:38-3145(-)